MTAQQKVEDGRSSPSSRCSRHRGAGDRRAAAAAAAPSLKTTFVPLANNANALLIESAEPSPKRRIVAINTHPDHNNNFNYFIGRELAARGYRALAVNYYGAEDTLEEFLPPMAAAVKYARSLPGVEKVVFATHSGGGPVLTFYEEIAEKGPAACRRPAPVSQCADTPPPASGRPVAARHQHRRAAPDAVTRSRGGDGSADEAEASSISTRRRTGSILRPTPPNIRRRS
jgi:hypothetical protein